MIWLWRLVLLAGTAHQGSAEVIYGIDVAEVVCNQTNFSFLIQQPSATRVIPFFLRTSGRGAAVVMTMQDLNGTVTSLSATRGLEDWGSTRRLSAWIAKPMAWLQELITPGPEVWMVAPDVGLDSSQPSSVDQPSATSEPADLETYAATRTATSLDAEVADTLCEDFFLLDGRSPVNLPDTWGEARSSFLEICLDSGVEADECDELLKSIADFSLQDPTEPFRPEFSTCESLMSWAATNYQVVALTPRRLKSSGSLGGYYSSGGGGAANGWGGTQNIGYGWTSTSLASRYAMTRTLSNGYSGLVLGAVAGSVVGSFIVRRYSSHWHQRNVPSNCTSSECGFLLREGEALYRDDNFATVLTTSSYSWPQVLTIHNISGNFIDNAEICPTPEAGTGLYFGLASPDELEWRTTWLGYCFAIMLWGTIACLVCCTLVLCGVTMGYFRRRHRQSGLRAKMDETDSVSPPLPPPPLPPPNETAFGKATFSNDVPPVGDVVPTGNSPSPSPFNSTRQNAKKPWFWRCLKLNRFQGL